MWSVLVNRGRHTELTESLTKKPKKSNNDNNTKHREIE